MKRYITRIIFGAAMLALALLAAIWLTSGKPVTAPAPMSLDFTNEIRWRFAMDENGKYELCFLTVKKEICRLPYNAEPPFHSPDFTLTRSAAAVISGYTRADGGKLYRIDANGAEYITDRAELALISDDGNTIAYLRREKGSSPELYLYKHDSGETIRIAEAASCHDNARCAISPDGGTVAYCLEAGGSFVGMVWNSGEYHELGAGVFPVAVADGMAHIYYARPNGPDSTKYSAYSFYVKSGDMETYLLSSYAGASPRFNYNLTEVYLDGVWSGTPAVIASGAENVAQLSRHIGPMADPYINFYSESQYNPFHTSNSSYYRYCISSFRGQPVCLGDPANSPVAVINDDYSFTLVKANDQTRSQLAADLQTSLYCANHCLYRTDGSGETELLIKNVTDFAASPDLSEVYYLTFEGELYYQHLNANSQAQFIAADAKLPSLRAYPAELNAFSWPSLPNIPRTFFGDVLYFTTNNGRTLNIVHGGGSPRELLSADEGSFIFCLVGQKPFVTHRIANGDTYIDANCYSIIGDRLRLVSSDEYA